MVRTAPRHSNRWRRAGSYLALIGLLFKSLISVGHAELSTGLQSGEAPAAQPFAYLEICSPEGIKRVFWGGQPDDRQPDNPSAPEGLQSPCVLCTALGAAPVACLDIPAEVAWEKPVLRVDREDAPIATPSRRHFPKLSRAPPRRI